MIILKKFLKYALYFLLFIFVVSFISACTNSLMRDDATAPESSRNYYVEEHKDEIQQDIDEYAEENDLINDPRFQDVLDENEDVFKQEYMDSCISEDSPYAYCNCTYEELRKNYTLSEIVDMGLELDDTGDIPDAMFDAFAQCIDYL